MNHESSWLINRDLYNGLFRQFSYNWVVVDPLCTANNKGVGLRFNSGNYRAAHRLNKACQGTFRPKAMETIVPQVSHETKKTDTPED